MNRTTASYAHTVAHEISLNTPCAYLDLEFLFSPGELSTVFAADKKKLHSWHLEQLHLQTLCSQLCADVSALSVGRSRPDMQQMTPCILNKHGGEDIDMRAEIEIRHFWVERWSSEINKLQIEANAVVARMQMQKEAKMQKRSNVRMELEERFKMIHLQIPPEAVRRGRLENGYMAKWTWDGHSRLALEKNQKQKWKWTWDGLSSKALKMHAIARNLQKKHTIDRNF